MVKKYRPSIAAAPLVAVLVLAVLHPACSRATEPAPAAPLTRNLVVITVDTLRADRVGSSGYAPARTPVMDGLAARGTRFTHAYAPTPITLPSHASLLTGRYPPGHGARHNGMRVAGTVPLLAESLARAGFATGAFVGAFPLDRRFGLSRGFEVYDDQMPRAAGRLASERDGREVVTSALAWLEQHRSRRFFLWVHLFEPHAPYGRPGDGRATAVRYDDEVAEADRQIGRVVEAIGEAQGSTLVVVTADHGEAFGEHGEITHSLFVYDTTLQVPLIVAGPGVHPGTVDAAVSLVDVAPTAARLLGLGGFDADGVDLGAALRGGTAPPRAIYAESFAPLLDFGWSPLRSLREDGWKLIAAPRPELYKVADDPNETTNRAAAERTRAAAMTERVNRYSSDGLPPPADQPGDADDTASRLRALGYVGSGRREGTARPDPKDRRELAADLARVASGEVQGGALEAALRRILDRDPDNPQANLRLGFVLQESGRCPAAAPHFAAAIAGRLPGADPYLGLAACHAAARRFEAAATALRDADRAEPDNPVVLANLGIVLSDAGRPGDGVAPLERALGIDPEFHEARFNLAVALATLGKRSEAARHAEELVRRLPPGAPQRPEVERLRAAVR